jgi:hypothetical protein
LIAVANQGRAAAGRAPLSSALQAIYGLAAADFHDITVGSNGYKAGVGYDAVTGRGSPIVSLVVRDLVAYGTTTTAPASTVSTPAAPASTTGRMVKAVEMPTDSLATWSQMPSAEKAAIAAASHGFGGVPVSRAAYEPITVSLATASRTSLSRDVVDSSGRGVSAIGPQEVDAAMLSVQDKGGENALATSVGKRSNAAGSDESWLDSATDPLAALDRIERLINDCLESSAAFGGKGDERMDDATVDDCLANPDWLGGRPMAGESFSPRSPAQLAAAMLSMGAVGLVVHQNRHGQRSNDDLIDRRTPV